MMGFGEKTSAFPPDFELDEGETVVQCETPCLPPHQGDPLQTTSDSARLYTNFRQVPDVLSAEDSWFDALSDNSLVGVYRMTMDGRVLDSNDAFVALAGFESKTQLIVEGLRLGERLGDDWERLRKFLEQHGCVKDFECKFKCCQGETIAVLLSAVVNHRFVNGTVVRVAEEAERDAELIACKPVPSDVLEIKGSELRGRDHIYHVAFPTDAEGPGNGFWPADSAGIHPSTDQKVTGLPVLGDFLTQAVEARDVANLLLQCIESLHDTVLVVDPNGTILYANKANEGMYGYSKESLVGRPIHLVFGDSHPLASSGRPDQLLRDGSWSGEWIGETNDGKSVAVHVCARTFRDEAGELIAIVGSCKDISQIRGLEDELRRAQKMETIGSLAAGIAHDLRNFLSGIMGCTSLILADLPEDHGHAGEIESIHETARSASELANRLLAVARTNKSVRSVCSINQAIEKTAGMLRSSAPKTVRFKLELDGKLPSIICDPCQIEQVVMNLAVNALDAMPDGGDLVFRSGTAHLEEGSSGCHPEAEPGDYVFLSVQDTGIGMSPEVQRRIFEPLFTTKGEDEGTGLGLSVVYGIVREHHGAIGLDSRTGVGSRFTIYLPRESEHGLEEDIDVGSNAADNAKDGNG